MTETKAKGAASKKKGLLLKTYKLSFDCIENLYHGLLILFNGFWLGVLPKNKLYELDELYYNDENMYVSDGHNLAGLSDWEELVVKEYFRDCRNLLLLAAGGGREIYGLHKLGMEVDGYECNPKLVNFANDFLQRNEISSKVSCSDRDICPVGDKIYDGAIVGWGAYMLIQGRGQRIKLLQDIQKQLKPGSPVLLSFFTRGKNSKTFTVTAKIANCLRFISNRQRIEVGDSLLPNIKYIHFFSKAEIQRELNEAGFEMQYFKSKPYGHAVGLLKNHD